ncbi:amino acid ABC transporter substrate-binding protein [Chitinimonas arctica]|uniref:Amino acid ABC transporter substrate-binding protein n=1 Tax=Chitinimonas arctica TaxID=2594795 RepID=A0A516SBQ6_9NEIS|nr:transporter substrate-binding domain-containing protein [Chitinimonas arctica]QDQ25585.1 amino acid ABC transporter substrate-binding protein [Chitinimonas arctica]
MPAFAFSSMRFVLALFASVHLAAATPASDEVIYPAPEGINDVRHEDKLELLKGALEHTRKQYGGYTMRPAGIVMNKARQQVTLASGKDLTLGWGSTSLDMEKDFLPIRICLRKGLGGFRIALIAEGRQGEFDKVRSLDDLKKFIVGQGNGWAGNELLTAAGLNVVTSNYDSLFRMLAIRRIDLFPRGLSEAFSEYEANRTAVPNLAIEQSFLIRYDNPYYFFVAKENTRLAQRIEQGLRAMIKDGSFDEIFWRYNGEWIRRANVNERRVLHLQNSELPPQTPLADKSLWFDPAAPLPK